MGPRPNNLDLSKAHHNNADLTPPRFPQFHVDLPSPRSGEAPPALSPLDAFAQHSRMLAMKFDQEALNGKRLSRLPHADVAREMANRPGYFRHVSDSTEGGMSDLSEASEDDRPITGDKYKIKQTDKNKHKSQYPTFGRFSTETKRSSNASSHFFDVPEPSPVPEVPQGYFDVGAPRASSPEMVDSSILNVEAPSPNFPPSLTSSVDSYRSTSHPRTLTNESNRSQRSDHGLRLPRSPAYANSPRQAFPVRQDSLEDDKVSNHGSQSGNYQRDVSHGSARSRPTSPFTSAAAMHRSPSNTSAHSQNDLTSQLPKPKFNFSRPLSSHGNPITFEGRPSIEGRKSFETRTNAEQRPHRPSAASTMTVATVQSMASTPLSRQVSQDDTPTPQGPVVQRNMSIPRSIKRTDSDMSIRSANSPLRRNVSGPRQQIKRTGSDMSTNGGVPITPVQTNQEEDLPRGREMYRTSAEQRTSWIHNQFTWDQSAKGGAQGPQGSKSRDNSTVRTVPRQPASPTPSERVQKMAEMQIEATERLGRDAGFSSVARSRSADPRAGSRAQAKHQPTPSVQTESTDHTIRQTPLHQRAASGELTAEEHLEIGIQAHSTGSLTKSTYHLRLAAREGLPTAMLLYALACRHGWGMRPNQEDGVMWLRKAIESSGLQVADVDQTIANASRREGKTNPVAEAAERRKRKAQFGLAVYELGISYMNGWGCQKDKPLALQCYEVAGGWGDCDALAEAGYCYTQGIGCKKDMKKAAGLYRKAADLGMSMAGNSW
jgi:TPR repeat protein